MARAFLSYAREDAAVVERIAQDLRTAGIEIWLDRDDLNPGRSWVEQIEDAFSRADFLLFFISRNSLKSKWALKEYHRAFTILRSSGGTRIIPVLLQEVRHLPRFLANIQYADFSTSYRAGLQGLIRALQKPAGPKPKEIVDSGKLVHEVADQVAKLLGLEHPAIRHEKAETDKQLVFVIMAFARDMEPVFDVIAAAAASLGLTAKRVKDVEGDYRITDKSIEMIRSARLIVADLTHERPNVYFELGYARGVGRRVVTIARRKSKVHFDVKDWRYLEYVDSRSLKRDLKKRFDYELAADSSTPQQAV